MMFQADAAFALELIALGIGFWILVKTRSDKVGNLKGFGLFIGYFIIVVAFLALLCTGYYTLKYWEEGYFNRPYQSKMMMHGGSAMMNQIADDYHGDMMGKAGKAHNQCKMMTDKEFDHSKCEKMMKGEMEGTTGKKSGLKDNGDQSDHHPGMKDSN